MKQEDFTVIHVVTAVIAMDRAGGKSGQTNISRLCAVTPKRARRFLGMATRMGLLFTYHDSYRANVNRVCFSATETGIDVVNLIEAHKKTSLWELSGE